MENKKVLLLALVLDSDTPAASHSDGKIKSGVVTEKYRNNWDNIFGNKQKVGQA